MVVPPNGRDQDASEEEDKFEEQDREQDRHRDHNYGRRQDRGKEFSAQRRKEQQRAQLLQYIESVDYVILKREHLIELLQEFPDALEMIRNVVEERRAYEESARPEEANTNGGAPEPPRAVATGAADPEAKCPKAPREEPKANEEENPLFGFIRQHWKKILAVLAVGGILLVCWFWGPAIWAAFKAFVCSLGGEPFMKEALLVVGDILLKWLVN